MSENNNVVDFPVHKMSKLKSEVVNKQESSVSTGSSVSLSQRLRTTIDDGLKQQMREQMRNKNGI